MEDLLKTLEAEKSKAQNEVTNFETRLKENPAYAFEWADDAMKAAARIDVLNFVIASLSSNSTMTNQEKVYETISYLHTNLIYSAKYGHSSSSACSNIMEENKRIATATVYGVLFAKRGMIK